jgi:hypothetical protein
MKRCIALLVAAAIIATVAPAGGQVAVASNVPSNVPKKGLVAHWAADGDAKDSAGQNHGSLKGGATFAPGKFGQAFKLDGKDDYVDFGNPKALQITGSLTIAMWIRPDHLAGRQNLLHKAFGGEGDITLEPDGQVVYHYGSAGSDTNPYCFLVTDGRAGADCSSVGYDIGTRKLGPPVGQTKVKAGQWTHLVIMRDMKAKKLAWYVNGARVVQVQFLGSALTKASPLSLYVGKGHVNNYAGLIDDVIIWNRVLGATEICGVFDGMSAALPHITREASCDRIELIDGSVLIGKVDNESHTVATASVGQVKIPAARVVGLVSGDKKDPRVRLVLSDGQLVVGKMTGQVLKLTLAENSGVLKIPVDKIRQFGYRITKDRPAEPVASGPIVMLADGGRLVWTECKQKLQLATAYGVVDLPMDGVLTIQAVNPARSAHRVVFRNGSTLTGALAGEKLTLKLQLGPILTCPRRDVRGFVMLARRVEPTGPATVRMRNGDRLFGKIADPTLTVRTEFGELKVHTASVLTMTFDATKPTHAVTMMWDQTTIRGRLVQPTVTVAITPNGPSVKVKTAQIASITNSSAQPPPKVLKKVEQNSPPNSELNRSRIGRRPSRR